MNEPIAYTYEADTHCPACTEARFGRSAAGFIAEDSTDAEGNRVGVIAPWDEVDPETGLYCGDCGREIVEAQPQPQTHWHVAYGLAGYGPDAADSDGFAAFFSLAEALDYARDELATDVDSAHEEAHALALHASQYRAAWKLDRSRVDMQTMALDHYADAWEAIERMEALEVLRMNLDPKRRSAPMYVNDPAAYEALEQTQLDQFPIDVGTSSRLYVWNCDADCETDDE